MLILFLRFFFISLIYAHSYNACFESKLFSTYFKNGIVDKLITNYNTSYSSLFYKLPTQKFLNSFLCRWSIMVFRTGSHQNTKFK